MEIPHPHFYILWKERRKKEKSEEKVGKGKGGTEKEGDKKEYT